MTSVTPKQTGIPKKVDLNPPKKDSCLNPFKLYERLITGVVLRNVEVARSSDSRIVWMPKRCVVSCYQSGFTIDIGERCTYRPDRI